MIAKNLTEWKYLVLRRDDNICQRCGDNHKIVAHHKWDKSAFPKLALDTENGITYCYKCHYFVHRYTDGNQLRMFKNLTKETLTTNHIKNFRMQASGADGKTIRTSIPRDVIRKEAGKHYMSTEEFISKFRIEWRYNSFPGIYGTFVSIKENK